MLKLIFLLYLLHFCHGIKTFTKSDKLSWDENAIFTGFFESMISTDISTSIWSEIARIDGKSYKDIFAEEIGFEGEIDASLAKMIVISDHCLHDLLFNQSSVDFKVWFLPFLKAYCLQLPNFSLHNFLFIH